MCGNLISDQFEKRTGIVYLSTKAETEQVSRLLYFRESAEHMTADEIRELIQSGELWKFYKCKAWTKLKTQVLRDNHYECAECKRQGIITRYDVCEDGNRRLLSTVHHVCHVRDHPELALSRWYKDYETGEMEENLIPVCKACHNKLHPEKFRGKKNGYTNEERW